MTAVDMPHQSDLAGRRVLVIEDEYMISMFITEALQDIGCEVVATADRIEPALEKAKVESFDIAIVDVNLRGEQTHAVVDALAERGKPFVIATGYGTDGLPERMSRSPRLCKPFMPDDLEKAMRLALQTTGARA